MKRIEHPTARFWRKVRVTPGCWEWLGGRFSRGYGRFAAEPTLSVRAHRYAWEVMNGPIPAGLIVCHHCDNPICVNHAHLFLGTHKDNAEDRDRKGRTADRRGERHHLAKLSVDDVKAIRGSDEPHAVLANTYGVHVRHIGRVRRAENWSSA